MSKLFTFDMVSADGYFAREDGQIDWHNVDAEFNDFALRQLDEIGTLLFGRVTYELMASWWPTEKARQTDSVVAGKMNQMPKLVAAKVLTLPWENSTVIQGSVEAAVKKLKEKDGKDLAIFGSSILSVSLLDLGLIDEVRIIVNPVLLGSGRSLFAGSKQDIKLRLERTQKFKSGNVLMVYSVKKD